MGFHKNYKQMRQIAINANEKAMAIETLGRQARNNQKIGLTEIDTLEMIMKENTKKGKKGKKGDNENKNKNIKPMRISQYMHADATVKGIEQAMRESGLTAYANTFRDAMEGVDHSTRRNFIEHITGEQGALTTFYDGNTELVDEGLRANHIVTEEGAREMVQAAFDTIAGVANPPNKKAGFFGMIQRGAKELGEQLVHVARIVARYFGF